MAISQVSSVFRPEFRAAKLLCKLPDETRVAVFPRPIENILQESSARAIFANAFNELDHRDERWALEPQSVRPRAQHLLIWTGQAYELRRIVRGAPPHSSDERTAAGGLTGGEKR
jgi:hypothetical protein